MTLSKVSREDAMTLRKFGPNKDVLYKAVSFLSNVLLVLGTIFVASYLAAPLLGGNLSAYAIIVYASWIATALVLKLLLRRARKGLRIRASEYLIACLCSIINLVLWFRYPIGVILSILSIVGFVFAYRSQDKRKRTQGLS